MSDKDVDKIDAVNFDNNDNSVFLNQAATKQVDKPAPGIWFGLGGLLLLALLVIFVLPSIVTEYELPLERRVDLADTPVAEAVANTASAISPFQEAQRALQRKEAQDVLAELLTYQTELDVLDVAVWGQQAYEASLEQASIGDEYYRAQDFVLARESYEAGREGLSRARLGGLAGRPRRLALTDGWSVPARLWGPAPRIGWRPGRRPLLDPWWLGI